MTVKEDKILVMAPLTLVMLLAFIFYGWLTSEQSLSSDVVSEYKEAQRLLVSRLNIISRRQAVSNRLERLQSKFLASGDLDQAGVELLQEVERISAAVSLPVTQKNVVNYSKPLIGVNLEGKTGPETLFRFLQRVTESKFGLQVQRLQIHVLANSKLISYQITLTIMLVEKRGNKG